MFLLFSGQVSEFIDGFEAAESLTNNMSSGSEEPQPSAQVLYKPILINTKEEWWS